MNHEMRKQMRVKYQHLYESNNKRIRQRWGKNGENGKENLIKFKVHSMHIDMSQISNNGQSCYLNDA